MLERNAEHIIAAHLTMEHSLIPLMTEEEPLEFVCGAGMMIKGFDAAVASMEVGQTTEVHLMPEEAYGQPDPDAIFTVELAQLPGAEELEAGQQVYLQNAARTAIPGKSSIKG